MAGEINSSFIPKKEVREKQRRSKKIPLASNVFLLIAVIIFLSALLAGLGVFMYDRQIDSSNARALATLEQNQEDYGISAIEEFIDLNNRIRAAEQILNRHVNVADIFGILEADTLTDVYLSGFSFGTEGDLTNVSARGFAPTYTHVALQADQYSANNQIKDLLLSNVNQSREGGIEFDLNFSVDRDIFIVNN